MAVKIRGPEVILDDEHERIFERVCAIDVGKDIGTVCLRGPAATAAGRRSSKVWDVAARSRAVSDLASELVEAGVEKVTVESTSDYWRIWFYLLEAHGLDVQLVNAREVRNVPGRPKTDKLDAVWLAKLTEKGLLRPSFVPPRPIRVLRDYTRLRSDLTGERARYYQRLEKLLEDALIKVTAVASRIDGLSVRDMLEALIAGERDPRVLAGLARGRMQTKHSQLVEALTGQFDDHHAELARMLLDQIDGLNRQIEQISTRIDVLLTAIPIADVTVTAPHDDDGDDAAGDPSPPLPAVTRPPAKPGPVRSPVRTARDLVDVLDEIPGVGRDIAQVIIAEVGLDMSVFPSPGHLMSWAKLCPRTIQSGKKHSAGRTGKGNPYLKAALGDAAPGAGKTQTFLGERHRRILKRRGKLKAVVATARCTLGIAWHLLDQPGTRFHDLGTDYYTSRQDKQRRVANHVRQLTALGYQVTLTAPAA